MTIRDNERLISLRGLDGLVQVGGTLSVVGNPALSSVMNVDTVRRLGGLEILANETLPKGATGSLVISIGPGNIGGVVQVQQ